MHNPLSINRRSFIANTGLMVASGILSAPILGCAEYQVDIPCLGPASPPAPALGMTYIWASKIGCALDCDLRTGHNKHSGGTATDDGPRINAAMAEATATNPITLIIDGSALVSGLFMPAGGYWNIAGLGCGTGFFIKEGTNNDCIHNGPPEAATPSDPGPPAPPRGSSVSLSNFSINGNRGNGRNGDSTTGARQGSSGVWYFGINLVNLDKITINKVVVVNAPAYCIRLSNVGHVAISGCVLKNSGVNADGLHFNGPANDITVTDCQFATGDDSIALNCPEGYSGSISRVTVTGCTFDSFSLMRLYTRSYIFDGRDRIDTITVKDCRGVLAECAFIIGMVGSTLPNSVDGLVISDCDLTAPVLIGIAENFGSIECNNVAFTAESSIVGWDRRQPNHDFGFMRPSPLEGTNRVVGSSLALKNCAIKRRDHRNAGPLILANSSSLDRVEFNGFSVQNSGTSSTIPELVNVQNGSIVQLILDSVSSANIDSPVSPGGFSNISSVSGSGVLATGWEFPDSVMADGFPYISANSGLPSIKIGGVVERYLLG